MIDAQASIVPGRSAAGFRLGQTFLDVVADLGTVPVWGGEQPLTMSIDVNPGWLQVPMSLLTNGDRDGNILFFSHGMVELKFAKTGVLYEIVLAKSYVGTLLGDIGIGSKLSEVQRRITLEYDDGDEMYYSADEDSRGVAFYASEGDEDLDDDRIIRMISVHDWSISH